MAPQYQAAIPSPNGLPFSGPLQEVSEAPFELVRTGPGGLHAGDADPAGGRGEAREARLCTRMGTEGRSDVRRADERGREQVGDQKNMGAMRPGTRGRGGRRLAPLGGAIQEGRIS